MRSPCTTMKSSPCSRQLEKARVQQRRPNAAKKKKRIKKKKKLKNRAFYSRKMGPRCRTSWGQVPSWGLAGHTTVTRYLLSWLSVSPTTGKKYNICPLGFRQGSQELSTRETVKRTRERVTVPQHALPHPWFFSL